MRFSTVRLETLAGCCATKSAERVGAGLVTDTFKAAHEVLGVSFLNAISAYISGGSSDACVVYETITVTVWAGGARANGSMDWDGCTK